MLSGASLSRMAGASGRPRQAATSSENTVGPVFAAPKKLRASSCRTRSGPASKGTSQLKTRCADLRPLGSGSSQPRSVNFEPPTR